MTVLAFGLRQCKRCVRQHRHLAFDEAGLAGSASPGPAAMRIIDTGAERGVKDRLVFLD
jgi:threonine/homoserine/homoserine lactone efflux protein